MRIHFIHRRHNLILLVLLLLSILTIASLLSKKPHTLLVQFDAPLPNTVDLADPTQRYLFYQNPSDKKCLPPDGIYRGTTRLCVGLNHYIANLAALLRESIATNRTPIIKPICLCGRHNNGNFIRTTLTRYLDLSASQIAYVTPTDPVPNFLRAITNSTRVLPHTTPFAELAAATESLVIRDINSEREFVTTEFGVADYEKHHPQLHFLIRESRRVRDLASAALAEITAQTPSFVCVRARRGDKLWGFDQISRNPCLDKCTRPKNIARVLRNNNVTAGDTIYLLTNEPKKDFFDPLTGLGYPNIVKMGDIESISSAGLQDNFLAFAAEQALCRHAKGVINSDSDSIAMVQPFDVQFQQPAQFHATLTPYKGDCHDAEDAKNIEACRLAKWSFPPCKHVCNSDMSES